MNEQPSPNPPRPNNYPFSSNTRFATTIYDSHIGVTVALVGTSNMHECGTQFANDKFNAIIRDLFAISTRETMTIHLILKVFAKYTIRDVYNQKLRPDPHCPVDPIH